MKTPRVLHSLLPLLVGASLLATTILAGASADDRVTFDFALYFAPEPKADPEQALDAWRTRAVASQADWLSVTHRWESIADYAPPGPQAFRYMARGLEMSDGANIAESTRVSVLTFGAPRDHLLAANRIANELVADLAEATAGFPWDEECRLLYSPAKWRETRVATWQGEIPDVRGHVNMHAYRNPELVRIITLGMRKFGQPDLVLTGVATGSTRSAGNVINACAQRLIEGQEAADSRLDLVLAAIRHEAMRASALENPQQGATGRLAIHFTTIPPDDGDPANTLWALEFPGFEADSGTEVQALAFASIFGSTDEVTPVQGGDPEMRAASERARRAFARNLPRYRKGFAPNERLLIKAGFAVSGGKEYMWVEVNSFTADAIVGILANDSHYDESLRHGKPVTIPLADVYDYLHYQPDGTEEGNETGKILERRER